MAMTEEAKRRLNETASARRLAKPRAKDYAPDEWLIHLDLAIEQMARKGTGRRHYDPQPGWELPRDVLDASVVQHVGVTLKYVPDAVVVTLTARLHGVKVRYACGPNRVRETWVLPALLVYELLNVLRLDAGKYATNWTRQDIKRCRTTPP